MIQRHTVSWQQKKSQSVLRISLQFSPTLTLRYEDSIVPRGASVVPSSSVPTTAGAAFPAAACLRAYVPKVMWFDLTLAVAFCVPVNCSS